MAPKKEKKKKAKKAPAYLAGEADLAPFGVQANQIVRTALGTAATVLGVKPNSIGQPALWVKYASGLEAPLEGHNLFAGDQAGPSPAAGYTVAGQAVHLTRAITELQAERTRLDVQWEAYNRDQATLKAAADKKKKKKPQPAPVAEAAAGELGSAADATAAGGGREAAGGEEASSPAAAAAS